MVRYRLSETFDESPHESLTSFSPLIQQLLFHRGITNNAEAEAFLNPSYDTQLHDPFLLHDMEKAVDRILKAMRENEQIAIFSDYDCDGIPGAVVLHDFFKASGYTHFQNYIPHRHYEGFGFGSGAAQKLADEGVNLIITIDCGMADHEAVALMREKGVDVIITDHHEKKDTLPEAVAVVNPKLGGTYPFDGLCGAGVVFKLAQALMQKGSKLGQFEIAKGQDKWWLDMVGVATIADMVPLVDENRVFAHYGLHVLRKSRRPGIQHLLRKQKVNQRHLTEDDIGFTIGPRINAASRMDTPEDAFLMLATHDEGEAGAYVEHLEKLNNERRGQVASMTKEIHKRMKSLPEIPNVLVLGNPAWRPSLVGLTASKLVEEYGRLAFLWGRDGNGVIKGSCRSNGKVSVIALMNELRDVLLEHGGHMMSGGFSVIEDKIHSLPSALNDAFISLGEKIFISNEIVVDASIMLDDINRDFIHDQNRLSPFGTGNFKPLYEIKGVSPKEVLAFGKAKEHTRLVFSTRGLVSEAIAFFKHPADFQKEPKVGETMTLYAHVEQSYFMGRQQTRLRLIDVV